MNQVQTGVLAISMVAVIAGLVAMMLPKSAASKSVRLLLVCMVVTVLLSAVGQLELPQISVRETAVPTQSVSALEASLSRQVIEQAKLTMQKEVVQRLETLGVTVAESQIEVVGEMEGEARWEVRQILINGQGKELWTDHIQQTLEQSLSIPVEWVEAES